MATTEERVDKLETRFSTLEQQFATTMAKVDSLLEESKQQREDIRRAQEKHDADMREIREESRRSQEKYDAEMKEIRNEIRDALKNLQGLTIAAVVGIAAISVGVLGFLWTTARSMETPPVQTMQYQAAESATK
ncbi:MAG: hypothetical protein IKZ53_07860 [Selenomonadaceae bacterium]|nr:hypothetical protein [Selenomonadaceae bacterium]